MPAISLLDSAGGVCYDWFPFLPLWFESLFRSPVLPLREVLVCWFWFLGLFVFWGFFLGGLFLSALVGVGGGRALSTSVFWVWLLGFLWSGVRVCGWCGGWGSFFVVVLFAFLSFPVFFHCVDDGVFKEFGGLWVSPGGFFNSFGCCL